MPFEDNIKSDRQRRKEMYQAVVRAGRTDAAKEKERILLSNPTTKIAYNFTNVKNANDIKEFNGVEFTEFSAVEGQQIIHGVINIYEYDSGRELNVLRTEDIYVYQPRFEGRNNFVLGPRYKSDNTLNNNAAYAFKDPSTGEVYVGNIPKREITTNRQFDFDVTNASNFEVSCQKNFNVTNKSLNRLINISYDRDPNTGNIKAVNLSNPEEKRKLDEYLRKNANPAVANSNLDVYIQLAEEQLIKAEQVEKDINEAVNRISLGESVAEKQAQSNQVSTTNTLADENAKLINNMIKYGIRPSYASPMQAGPGGMPRRMGGPGMPPPPRPGRGPHHR